METAFLAALLCLIAFPGIIDEDIKPSLFRLDLVEYRADLVIITVITAYCYTGSACLGHQCRRLMNCSWQWHSRIGSMLGSARYINCGTSRS